MTKVIAFVFSVLLMGQDVGRAETDRIRVKVVNETNEPVKGASVQWIGSSERSLTNEDGEISTGLTIDRLGFLEVKRAGYYTSRLNFGAIEILKEHKDGYRKVLLKPKRQPTAMFAKNVTASIPNQRCGYDLVMGDWVQPYGTGQIADITFGIIGDIAKEDKEDTILETSFSNELDGIIELDSIIGDDMPDRRGSELRSPTMASPEGYLPKHQWKRRVWREQGELRKEYPSYDKIYIIRVRSRLNEKGELVSALYGKIYDGPNFWGATQEKPNCLTFLYYLNPDGSRNLEFDPQRNLLPVPRGGQRVNYP